MGKKKESMLRKAIKFIRNYSIQCPYNLFMSSLYRYFYFEEIEEQREREREREDSMIIDFFDSHLSNDNFRKRKNQ